MFSPDLDEIKFSRFGKKRSSDAGSAKKVTRQVQNTTT